MKATLIFCLALVAVSASNMRRPLSKAQNFEAFAQLDAHPLGNLVMSQLSLHLAAEGIVEDIVDLVQGLIASVQQQQQDHDNLHTQQLATCEADQSNYSEQRDSNQAAEAAAAQRIVDTQALLDAAEINLEEVAGPQGTIAELSQRLEDGQNTRDEQRAAFEEEDAWLDQAINAVQEAVRLVAGLNQGLQSFVQMKERFQAVTEKLQRHSDKLQGRFEIYTPIVQSLIQVADHGATTEVLEKILDLLQNLQGMLQAARNAGQAQETERQNFWDNEKSDLTNQRNTAISRKKALENDIVNYGNIISSSETAEEQHGQAYVYYSGLYTASVAQCAAQDQQYQEETAIRDNEEDILTRLLGYMEDNADQFQDYLLERVN